jgi:hypothetical protein
MIASAKSARPPGDRAAIVVINPEPFGNQVAHADGIPPALFPGAAVGIATVSDNGPAPPVGSSLLTEKNRCRLDKVTGEHGRNRHRNFRVNKPKIFFSIFFQTCRNTGGLKTRAIQLFHRYFPWL